VEKKISKKSQLILERSVEKPRKLIKGLQEAINKRIEGGVFFALFLNLVNGVYNRGMMFPSKISTNFRERCACK
jgi:hypothetical protein